MKVEKFIVEDLVNLKIIEKPLDGNHGGIHPKSTDYVEIGIPFIMASDLSNERVNFSNCKFISKKQAQKLKKGFAQIGDVLLSHKATIGRTALVQSNDYPFLVLTPQVTYYRIKNKNKLDNYYLMQYFKSPFFQNILQSWAGSGSTRAYIGITNQLKLPILLPDIKYQKYIKKILKPLDDKIQLNTETNQTLENIAQAIFKSWFIDFDPVHTKANALAKGDDIQTANFKAMMTLSGKTDTELAEMAQQSPTEYAQLQQTAQAFPSEFGENGLPLGWDIGELGKIATAKGGFAFKGKDFSDTGEHKIIKIKNITGTGTVDISNCDCVSDNTVKKLSKFILKDGDLIMAMTGATVGKIGLINKFQHSLYLNQRVAKFESEIFGKDISFYLYCLFNYPEYFDAVVYSAQGSAQPNISSSAIEAIKVVIPPKEFIISFIKTVKPIFTKWIANNGESKNLEKTRDTLLPKLLNGEL